MKFYCINLERRPDRKEQAMVQFYREGLDVEFIKASDGNKEAPMGISLSNGEWGCSDSHIRVYKDIVKNSHEISVIFEDDVNLTTNFKNKLNKILKEAETIDWDLIYLGHYLAINKGYVSENLFTGKGLGTHAYVIRLGAAQKMNNFEAMNLRIPWDGTLSRISHIRLLTKNPIAYQTKDGTIFSAFFRQFLDGDIGASTFDWAYHIEYWSPYIILFVIFLIKFWKR
jgi:GR25 family glycosyltransferase involved in LPS biosynthesis